MEERNKKIMIILAAVSSVLFISSVFFIVKWNSSDNEKEEFRQENERINEEMKYLIEYEKKELQNDLTIAQAQYDELLTKIDNDSLKFKLERERDRTQALLEELERTKATSAAEIRRLNKELETLRAVLKDYTRQIAELSTENESLKKENTSYKRKVETANKQIDELAEEKELLTEKVDRAAQLEAKNARLSLLKKNGKEVKKIKNAKQIKLSFTIAKNVTSTAGDKTAYVRIFMPDMEVLTKSEENKFQYEDSEIRYSMKRDFEFTGEETSVEMFWNIEETLPEGEYKAYIFVDGNMIGEGSGTFK